MPHAFHRITTAIAAVAFFPVALSAEEPATDARPVAAVTESSAVLQLKLQHRAAEVDTLTASLDKMKSYGGNIAAARAALKAAVSSGIQERQLSDLRNSLTALRAAVGTAPTEPDTNRKLTDAVSDFRKAVTAIGTTIENASMAASKAMELDAGGNEAGPLADIVGQAYADTPETPVWYQTFPGISDLLSQLRVARTAEAIRQRLTPAMVDRALPEANNITREIADRWVGTVATVEESRVTRVEKAVNEAIDGLTKKLEKARTDYEDINKRLVERERNYQEKISQNLLPIFWGSLGAIVVTFVVLRVKADASTELMIRERTVIELLAIGLFLTTVLFLGAGGFIEKATLGTLLGTLAGYLFTRRATPTAPGAAEETEGAPPEPAGPPKFDDAAQTVTLPAFPKGATFVTIFAKPVAGGTTLTLAYSASRVATIDRSKLTAGTDYELWYTATNAHGESKASGHSTFKL